MMDDPPTVPQRPAGIPPTPPPVQPYDPFAPEPAPSAPAAPPPGEWVPVAPASRKRRGTTFYDVVFILDLAWLGLNGLGNVLLYLLSFIMQDFLVDLADQAGGGSPGTMWFNNIHNLVTMGIIPFVWVVGTRVGGLTGALTYLHMQPERFVRGLGEGVILGLGLLVVILPLLFILEALGVPMDDGLGGERFLGITIPLVIATSLIAGVAEEILFRGILQRWVGVLGQAVLFGLFHLLAGWIALVVTGLVGVVFGYAVRRGYSLWTVIVAHVFYDLVLLGWTYYDEQQATSGVGFGW